ncbi:MAG: methylenetetrahydrofolate reductase [NAD(P)H] [Bacteroidetes bacterium]|nr:methylenetetrahydrofolate reductase [NAD(P)H] [Bacteroidota bacterium]
MKIDEILAKTKKTLFSFELLPPLKGSSIQLIYDIIDPLIEFEPQYINVTYHREEVVYKKHENGLLEPRIVRKRPGTVGIAAAVMNRYKTPVVPHMICAGFNKEETENALIDLDFLGIDNILVLRGDADKSTRRFEKEKGGHAHAIDLLKQIMDMNHGKYMDNEIENSTPTNFVCGVAGYPEKHCEAPNMELDLEYLKAKIDAGAKYIVTQMFYDNDKYFSFVELCRKKGINVPIVPGIKPISLRSHLSILPQTFYIDLPEELTKEVIKCKTDAEVRRVGVEWSIKQCKDLVAHNVPIIHFYTMGKSDNIATIAKAVY